jgi:outer membrane protein assembly factor BamB
MSLSRLLPAAVLLLAATLPGGSAAAQEATACAPAAVASGSAMPGGDATLSAAQPGPAPAGLPAICWAGAPDAIQVPGAMLVGDVVVTATINGDVEALRVSDGADAWVTRVDSSFGGVGGITVDDATVYAGGPEGLNALDAATGAERWLFPVDAGPLATGMGAITPVVSGDLLVMAQFTSSWDDATVDFVIDRSLVAVATGTGAERWRTPLFAEEPPGTPSTDGTLVAIADGDGRLRVLDATTGADVWQLSPDALGSAPASRIAIAGDRLITGLRNGEIVALSAADGSELWRTASTSFTVAALTVVDGGLYVNGFTQLQALDVATGSLLWDASIQLGAPPLGFQPIPAVVDGQVILGTTELYEAASLVSWDAADGTESWRLTSTDLGAILSPVVAGGRVYAPAFGLYGSGVSGGLVAFGTAE